MVRPASDGAAGSEGSSAPAEAGSEPAEAELKRRDELPPFARPYVGYFAQLRASIELHQGFVLAPVEVPSMDIGRALVEWLEREGVKVTTVSPAPDAWRTLARALLSLRVGEDEIVVVLGPREVTDELREGLNLLNLQRDTLARQLDRPLVWCGLRSFLDATWEQAPDFWSIRDVTMRVPLVATDVPPVEQTLQRRRQGSPEPQEIANMLEAARKVGDEPNVARLLLMLTRSLMARRLAEEATPYFTEAAEIIARNAFFRRTLEEALVKETQADLSIMLGATREAVTGYEHVLTMYEALDHMAGVARTLLNLGMYDPKRHEGAARDYERALAIFHEIGDEDGEALALAAHANLHMHHEDFDSALADYERALQLCERVENHAGKATVLLGRGSVRSKKMDLEGALHDYRAALEIFASDSDTSGLALTLAYIASAHLQRGEPTEALDVAARALAVARQAHNDSAADLANSVLEALAT